jgi:hypothetical protein
MSDNDRFSPVKTFLTALGALLSACAATTSVLAADHTNLEEGLPVSVEDSYPIGYGKQEVQGVFAYDHLARNGGQKNFFSFNPRLAVGLFPGFQVRFGALYQVGSDGSNSGPFNVGGVYQLNDGGEAFPTFALSGGVDVHHGFNTGPVETSLKLVATKPLGNLSEKRDIHLNIGWTHNTNPGPDERSERYAIGVAYAQPFDAMTLLVVALVGEQELEQRTNRMMVEFGIRHKVSDELVVSAGGGIFRITGPSEPTDGFRFVVGFQRNIDLFGPKQAR